MTCKDEAVGSLFGWGGAPGFLLVLRFSGVVLRSRGLSGVNFSLALITIVGEGRYKENAQGKCSPWC